MARIILIATEFLAVPENERSEMKPLIEYFDRAYIINLADRTDRRREAEREFQKVGINFPNEKVLFFTATRPLDKGGFSNVGLRGCFTSHREILEIAEKDGIRNVLIFEDDVSFRSVENGQQIINQLACEDWDVVYFGYLAPLDHGLAGPLMPWSTDISGTHFYAVNGKFIGKLLRYMRECESRPSGHPDGGPMSPDAVFNHMRYVNQGIRLFLAVPSLAHQRSSRTDVHPKLVLDRIAWLAPILRGSRAIKHKIHMALDKIRLRRRLNQN
jgi:glycosyl transferase, family 25